MEKRERRLRNYINEIIKIHYILTSLEIFQQVQRYKSLLVQTLDIRNLDKKIQYYQNNIENEKGYYTLRRNDIRDKKRDHNVALLLCLQNIGFKLL